MATKTSSPGRTLLIFFICVAGLFGLAALGDSWKPSLGLDLEGGTRITLTATNDKVDPEKLEQAAGIIESRVNGSGVVEAEVSTQGSRNIIVEIPGKNRKDLVDSVKRTAQLRFRLVSGQAMSGLPVTVTPSASPSASPTAKASPSATASPTATSSATATPKPRPAPAFAAAAETPTPTPTATPTTLPVPQATPTVTPQTTKGSSVDDPLKWIQNPGSEWTSKFASFTCPVKGEDAPPVADNPDEPLIACTEDGAKLLLSKAVIEGTQLKSASYGTPPQGVGWVVQLALKGDAKGTFADVSRELYGNGGQFAMVLDGQVISYAGFNEPILDGNAQITGDFTESEAKSLANSLKYGALPIKFDPDVTTETVGATLAGDQLSAGILAGVIGLLIVMLYCLLYYRGLGLVVIASLIVAGVITYGTVLVLSEAAGFTLTLPGIAGLIVAVGITADSFIVYFERIRDEMRDGKSMRVAVESGWVRARNTCLAADTVSLLAGVVLYIFAIGVVRGFAFALVISTIIDIVVFFWFTKPTVSLLARRPYFNNGGKYSGLSRDSLGVDDEVAPASSVLVGGKA